MRDYLPRGWCNAALFDLCRPTQWQTISTRELITTGYPVYGANGQIGYYSAYNHEHPTILITCRGATCGALNISRPRSWINGNAMALDSLNEHIVLSQYAYYALQNRGFADVITGTAQPQITRESLKAVDLPIAPFAEQRRLVEKLEEMLSRMDAAQARLGTIPRILKRFRQSVLASACSGRLTGNWREENSEVNPASKLAENINKSRRSKALVEILEAGESPNELPPTWIWVRFGSVIGELRNGVSIRPSVDPPGTPMLRISAARRGKVDLDEVRYLPNGSEFLPSYSLRERDLLFTRYNGSLELLGVCGMVRGIYGKVLLYPDKLMRVRFDHDFVLPEYAEIFFQAPDVHDRVIAKSKSSAGQNGVSGADIKSQPFALPPLEEQREIVRRVEALFKTADALEARYRTAKAHVDKLTQSILAKAFRGELVPQDPNDEPASIMLEKIREARVVEKKPKQQRRTTARFLK